MTEVFGESIVMPVFDKCSRQVLHPKPDGVTIWDPLEARVPEKPGPTIDFVATQPDGRPASQFTTMDWPTKMLEFDNHTDG
jgi:hypothetical protein